MWILLFSSLVSAQTVPSAKCTLGAEKTEMTSGWYKIQGDMVNLREQPSTTGTVLAQIPLGSTAKVSGCVKQEKIGDKSGCWYKVDQITTKGVTTQYESAHLYFTALARCYIAGDFDEDGVLEEAFLSQTGEEQFQVRLSDPNAKVPMTWIVEDAYSNFTSIYSVPKSKTGRTMLVMSIGPEACGYTGYEHYFIYDSKGKPTLHKSISEQSFSDSPAYFNSTIDWKNDGTLVYNEDYTTGSSSQKYCLKGFQYTPCGPKTETKKEVMDTGL